MPAPPGSAQPQLTVSSRGVLLSWIERDSATATLKWSERQADAWSAPATVASGDDWFVNWADVPSVVRLTDGTLAAHWLQKSGSDTYAYDVRVSHSSDNGSTWSAALTPHSDGTQTRARFRLAVPGAGRGPRSGLARWPRHEARPRRARRRRHVAAVRRVRPRLETDQRDGHRYARLRVLSHRGRRSRRRADRRLSRSRPGRHTRHLRLASREGKMERRRARTQGRLDLPSLPGQRARPQRARAGRARSPGSPV